MGRITDFYEKHISLFGITGWLIAVIAIILTVYFYIISRQAGEISYIVTTTKIYDSTIPSSDIVVSRRSGEPINENIFASEIVLWNSGDLRADEGGSKPDVPITVSVRGNGKIIDTVLQGYNYKEIAKYELLPSPEATSLQVLWKNFRPGFGVRFTVLYTGNEDTILEITGDIFKFAILEKKIDSTRRTVINIFGYKFPTLIVLLVGFTLVMIVVFILLKITAYILRKLGLAWLLQKLGFVIPFFSVGLLIFIVLWSVWQFVNQPSPPI